MCKKKDQKVLLKSSNPLSTHNGRLLCEEIETFDRYGNSVKIELPLNEYSAEIVEDYTIDSRLFLNEPKINLVRKDLNYFNQLLDQKVEQLSYSEINHTVYGCITVYESGLVISGNRDASLKNKRDPNIRLCAEAAGFRLAKGNKLGELRAVILKRYPPLSTRIAKEQRQEQIDKLTKPAHLTPCVYCTAEVISRLYRNKGSLILLGEKTDLEKANNRNFFGQEKANYQLEVHRLNSEDQSTAIIIPNRLIPEIRIKSDQEQGSEERKRISTREILRLNLNGANKPVLK